MILERKARARVTPQLCKSDTQASRGTPKIYYPYESPMTISSYES